MRHPVVRRLVAAVKLEKIVELWRETLAPEAALAASNVASKLAPEEWPANGKELHTAWMKRARKPSDSDVVELMRVCDFKKATADQLLARFQLMEAWEPHPIATRWLVDVFARQTRAPLLAGQKCFRRVFNLLIDHIDKPGAERLQSWIGTHVERIAASTFGADFFDGGLKRVLEKSTKRLAAARDLKKAELAKLEKAGLLVEPARAPRAVTTEALVAAVYETPWDDAPRLVLADVLQQNGDPRGEFIALDLLPELTAEQRKQRNALLKAHGKAWFPEALHRIVKRDVEYERGFIGRGKLVQVTRQAIELSTFRELEVDAAAVPQFDHPVFRGVESWRGVYLSLHDDERAKPWREHAPVPRVRRLGVSMNVYGCKPQRIVDLVRPAAWPNITEFVIDISTAGSWPLDSIDVLEELVRVAFERFPNVTHVDLRPFARFDRKGNADELHLPNPVSSLLVADYDHGVANRQTWFEWLTRRGVPVVIWAPAWVEQLQARMPGVPVRLGKERPWSSLPR
jgi:uncharacterized protein (TIGR02996 family)